jgi:hypothetical protein
LVATTIKPHMTQTVPEIVACKLSGCIDLADLYFLDYG